MVLCYENDIEEEHESFSDEAMEEMKYSAHSYGESPDKARMSFKDEPENLNQLSKSPGGNSQCTTAKSSGAGMPGLHCLSAQTTTPDLEKFVNSIDDKFVRGYGDLNIVMRIADNSFIMSKILNMLQSVADNINMSLHQI